jgi:hypothetical protein
MTENRPLRVFLCHSSNDKPAVRELYQQLQAEPWIQPWLDEEALYPGEDWNIEIEKAVEASDAILVCLTRGSITKEGYIQRELRKVLDFADYKPEGTLFIIPVRLENCEPPRQLRKWQFADYFEGQRERAFQRLLVSLKRRADALDLKFEPDAGSKGQAPASKAVSDPNGSKPGIQVNPSGVSSTSDKDQDDAFAWLEALVAKQEAKSNPPKFTGDESTPGAEANDFKALGLAPPITQILTTYVLGDDLYDESFSVDDERGKYLGEYGVGIAEKIGVGEPKKVTALEIWLFDESDIQVQTKVIMAEYSYHDPMIRARLEAKGELIKAEHGKQLLIETKSLQLLARIIDISYGSGLLPRNSYFERITLELAIWPRAGRS